MVSQHRGFSMQESVHEADCSQVYESNEELRNTGSMFVILNCPDMGRGLPVLQRELQPD